MMIIYRHINHEYCLVHLQKRTWVIFWCSLWNVYSPMFPEKKRESILLEVIVHIHYTAYILLFLLHNQCHHIAVSRGDTSIATKCMMWCATIGKTPTIWLSIIISILLKMVLFILLFFMADVYVFHNHYR
jgi:hypothetical protein